MDGMNGEKKIEGRFPCHVWEMEDAGEAHKSFRGKMVRDYDEYTDLEDGTVLHWNYMWDEGNRYLVRCNECGGLKMVQRSEFHAFEDDDDYYSDEIPIASVEEGDLLNILWGPLDLEGYPYRSIRGNNFQYFWKAGKEPKPYDTEKLRKEIREKYKDLSPEKKELLEKMIRNAGRTEGRTEHG